MQGTTWKLSDVSFEKSFVYTLLESLFVGEKTSQVMRGTVRHELTSLRLNMSWLRSHATELFV